jgi:hypothetical protein
MAGADHLTIDVLDFVHQFALPSSVFFPRV